MDYINFILIVSLITRFTFDTLDKWGVIDYLNVRAGTKWFIPRWIPTTCQFCMSFWACLIIGVLLCPLFNLEWYEIILLSVCSQPVVLRLLL